MGFRPAGSRPVAVAAFALALALSTGAACAAGQTAAQPASAATAAKPAAPPAAADTTAQAAAAPAKPGDPTAGQSKAAACGACHGMDGNSTDPQYPKLAGQSEQYIVHQLELFKSGKRQNPIMQGMAAPLAEQDMHDIGAYFASQHVLPGVADQALVADGEKLYREGDPGHGVPACMACHSIDGSGNPGAAYPQLTSQHAQYIEARLKTWHDGGNAGGSDAHSQIMPMIAKRLDAHEIAAVASYIEGLHAVDAAAAPPAASAP